MNDCHRPSTRGLSKRAVVAGTLSCLTLGIMAANVIAIALFTVTFLLRLLATS